MGVFFKGHKSFSRAILTYCPTCWSREQASTATRIMLMNFGVAALGPVLQLTCPKLGLGRFLTGLLWFQVFLVLALVIHELGHACMGRLLGMRVFKIYLGWGKTWFKFRRLGFEFEVRPALQGGLVVAGHPSLQWLRIKQFLFTLAGPMVNVVLASSIWPFLRPGQLWSFQVFETRLQVGTIFFYVNLIVLLENLLPYKVTTPLGRVSSDGKRLFEAFFLSPEKRKDLHAGSFFMEAAVNYEQADFEAARRWAEEGLALYPDHELLLTWPGLIALGAGENAKAREYFFKQLDRGSSQPHARPITLNNIAYADVLLGGVELIQEADTFSAEAMEGLGWLPAIEGTRGAVLAAMGRYEEGLPLLHESLSAATNIDHKAQNACFIAEAEARRGNLAKAKEYLEEARKLHPGCLLLSRAESVVREAQAPTS